MNEPMTEAKDREFRKRCGYTTDWVGFEQGWEAAIDFSKPLIEAAIRTWIVMEGMDIAGDGSKLSLRAARRVMREVPHVAQDNHKGGCLLCAVALPDHGPERWPS